MLASCTQTQVYIVYFGHHKGDKLPHEIEATHFSYLNSVKETEEETRASLIYSYKHSINGFAASLTPDQASQLSGLEEVVSVIRSHPKKHVMHTTRSWEFVGLEEMPGGPHWPSKKGEDMLSLAEYGNDVIVGVLDSGFWPESKSFRDEGMRPIPKTWKGICQSGDAFNSSHCNRKVIGARYYVKQYEQTYGPLNRTLDFLSPRDKDGHGTHTASTVAGRVVQGASFLGRFAQGTASGGAPLARLAIYKACWAIPGQEKVSGNSCFEADMLAAIDDAIADGVHVLSVSIGSTAPIRYDHDGIAIGALHAVKHDIVVACSAGNSGPTPGTLSNPAPWIITVGASSLDRNFPAPVVLGNGVKLEGETVTTYKLEKKMFPLVYAGQVELPTVPHNISGQCMPNSLSAEKAKGKIVLCLRGNGTRIGKGVEVKRAGGAGYILGNALANGAEIPADGHVLPATAVAYNEAIKILNYINSSENPTATIIPATTILNTKPAPSMASFTSRGPNMIDSHTLKPDITAPGLNILAAWTGADAPTKLSSDDRIVEWNIYSGTSMSCPHVAGAAALIKAIHPDWSSAAIRSAIMTTAGLENNVGTPITDEMGNPADPFQFGAGHFQPTKSIDPGLVYDASYNDYLLYLCSGGLTNLDPSFKCPKKLPKLNDLNYPSIAIPGFNGTVTVRRSVTNVGSTESRYFAFVKPPLGYKVKVSPRVLSFKHVGQKKKFKVTFEADPSVAISKKEQVKYGFGWLIWSDGMHTVRSPMVVSSS